ncbi:Stage II sporulation protein E (SpoIIE) [compost metagenome]
MDLGLPIGLESDITPFVGTRKITLAKDDIIVLHTDGVTEAENAGGELFGIDRLCSEAVRLHSQSADRIAAGIIDKLMDYIGPHKVHDDITLLVLRHR